jgi:hypothetical protein
MKARNQNFTTDLNLLTLSNPSLIEFFPLYNHGVALAFEKEYFGAVYKFKQALRVIQFIAQKDLKQRKK